MVDLESMPAASALLIPPFFDRWETHLRVGAGCWEGTSHQLLFDEYTGEVLQSDVEDSGLGWMIGIGLDSMQLELRYRLGAGRPASPVMETVAQ